MAHYVAELITKSKKAKVKDKLLIQKKCFDTILDLWQHRGVMPSGSRPFEDLESVVRVIESLDSDKDTARYFHSARSSIISDEENSEIKKLLKIVEDIDYSAKVMIRGFLVHMSRQAIDKSKEWVRLAEAAKVNDSPAGLLFEFVEADTKRKQTLDYLTNRLKRFENSIEIANSFVTNMRKKINDLSYENEKDRINKTLGKKHTATKRKVAKKSSVAKKRSTTKKKVISKKKTSGKRRARVTDGKSAAKRKIATKKKSTPEKQVVVRKKTAVKRKVGAKKRSATYKDLK